MKQHEIKTISINTASINTAKLDNPIAHKIVIVDPDPTCLESAKLFFSECSCVITLLINPKMVLEYLNKHSEQVDLVILDITYSETSALELFKALKNDRNLDNIPVMLQISSKNKKKFTQILYLPVVTF